MQKLMKAMHKNEKGFTLVELMVVVVIIGVLVAIAIPIYNTIQGTAEENACHATQRTIDGLIVIAEADPDIDDWEALMDGPAICPTNNIEFNVANYSETGDGCPDDGETGHGSYRD